jgi:hypothetical protein
MDERSQVSSSIETDVLVDHPLDVSDTASVVDNANPAPVLQDGNIVTLDEGNQQADDPSLVQDSAIHESSPSSVEVLTQDVPVDSASDAPVSPDSSCVEMNNLASIEDLSHKGDSSSVAASASPSDALMRPVVRGPIFLDYSRKKDRKLAHRYKLSSVVYVTSRIIQLMSVVFFLIFAQDVKTQESLFVYAANTSLRPSLHDSHIVSAIIPPGILGFGFDVGYEFMPVVCGSPTVESMAGFMSTLDGRPFELPDLKTWQDAHKVSASLLAFTSVQFFLYLLSFFVFMRKRVLSLMIQRIASYLSWTVTIVNGVLVHVSVSLIIKSMPTNAFYPQFNSYGEIICGQRLPAESDIRVQLLQPNSMAAGLLASLVLAYISMVVSMCSKLYFRRVLILYKCHINHSWSLMDRLLATFLCIHHPSIRSPPSNTGDRKQSFLQKKLAVLKKWFTRKGSPSTSPSSVAVA